MSAFLSINEGRMTTYADLQAVYKQHREAQSAYYIQLEAVVKRIIKGYAEHLGVQGRGVTMNGAMTSYVTPGRLLGRSFEEDNSYEARTMHGKVMTTHIGIILEESERSTNKARVVVQLDIQKNQGAYHYQLRAPHSPDTPGIEGRIFNEADHTGLYEDISEVLLRVMDPEPFEQ